MKKRRHLLSLRTLFTFALITALLSAMAMFVTVSAESIDTAAEITANESFTVENELSIGTPIRNTNRLYATANAAVYTTSYGGELTEGSVAQQVYNGFYDNFVTTPGNSPFVVNMNPSVKINGIDSGNGNEQGEHIIDFDTTDQAFIDFCKGVNLGAIAFTYDHPEVFWIRNHSYTFSSLEINEKNDGTYEIEIKAITISTNEAYSGAYNQRGAVNSGIAAAKNSIQTGDTRYETLKNIHDYICTNATYDYDAAAQNEATKAHTAAPLFNGTDGKLVCEGYSKALKILCDQFGIPCALVSGLAYNGTSSEGEPHMWARVKMEDGNWYAVDVTWDDQSNGIVENYFLKGKNTMLSDHKQKFPMVNMEEVPIYYPELSNDDYIPNNSTTDNSSTTGSSTTSSSTTSSSTTSSSTTGSSPTGSSTTGSSTTGSSTTDTSNNDTSAAETTTTQAQPKQIAIKLDDPDNGFVKSAQIPDNAKAKAGNDDVELTKIKIIVTKLDDTQKKALSDGIRRINNSFDPDNSILEAYDIKLVDNNGNTVTITEGKVRICLTFSSVQTKKYTNYVYSVYHQKTEGDVERIKSVKYNAQGVWFESDKFSPFGLVSIEKSGGEEPSPGTGETILMTVIAVILLALAAGAIAIVVIRNRAASDEEKAPEAENADPENAETSEKTDTEANETAKE